MHSACGQRQRGNLSSKKKKIPSKPPERKGLCSLKDRVCRGMETENVCWLSTSGLCV